MPRAYPRLNAVNIWTRLTHVMVIFVDNFNCENERSGEHLSRRSLKLNTSSWYRNVHFELLLGHVLCRQLAQVGQNAIIRSVSANIALGRPS